MKLILITGKMGSGKTTALKYIHKKYHYPVIDIDDIVRELWEDTNVVSGICKLFHLDESYTNAITKHEVTKIVFQDFDKNYLLKLEKYLQPHIFDKLNKFLEDCKGYPYVFIGGVNFERMGFFKQNYSIAYCANIITPLNICVANALKRSKKQTITVFATNALINDIMNRMRMIDDPKNLNYAIKNDGSLKSFREEINKFVLSHVCGNFYHDPKVYIVKVKK